MPTKITDTSTTAALLVRAPLCDNCDTRDTEQNNGGFTGTQGIAADGIRAHLNYGNVSYADVRECSHSKAHATHNADRR